MRLNTEVEKKSKLSKRVALGRIAFFVVGLAPATVLLMFGSFDQLPSAETQNALQFLSLVLSILTGFSVSTISSIGDQRRKVENWRVARVYRSVTTASLDRIVILVYSYLATIAMVFSTYLIDLLGDTPELYSALVRISLSMGTASLLWSFCLPVAIYRAKKAGLDAFVDESRSAPKHEPAVPLRKKSELVQRENT